MKHIPPLLSLVLCLCLVSPALSADIPPMVVELCPDAVPDEQPGIFGPEKVVMSPKLDLTQVKVTESTRMTTNVTKPTITIYRPAKEKDTGTAMLRLTPAELFSR